MPDISIVIPTWNGQALLERFLPTVVEAAARYRAEHRGRVEIVVVDDGSTDGTLAWLAEQSRVSPVPVRVIRHEANLGFGPASNRGVREAAYPLVFLLNNDVAVEAGTLAPLAARFAARNERDRLFAVHCRVLDHDSGREVGTGKMGGFARGFLRVHRSYVVRGAEGGPYYSMFASGGSALFDRATFLELGGFDPLFAPFYLEDVELSYRAWKRGYTVEYASDSVVSHRFSSTIGPLAGPRVPRIGQRNRLIFHWMHLHDPGLLARHAAWVAILLVSGALTFRPRFVLAFADAVRLLPRIRARRSEERRQAQRSDREVLSIFKTLQQRADIRAYDDPAELKG